MKYMLLIYSNPANWAALPEAERNGLMAEYGTFTKDIVDSGEFVSGDPLAGIEAASTVRVRGGASDVTDGPFVETKEHLAGYYIVDVKDLDRALALAAKIPDARFGGVEVRPVLDMSGAEM
ncbi:MAG: YciI family protein [Actinobacteria bacterium]|nr:MAG: YciI family protein [Actinomycetota bacterium]